MSLVGWKWKCLTFILNFSYGTEKRPSACFNFLTKTG